MSTEGMPPLPMAVSRPEDGGGSDGTRRLWYSVGALLEYGRQCENRAMERCAEIAADEDRLADVPGWDAQLGDARATQRNIVEAIRARFNLLEKP